MNNGGQPPPGYGPPGYGPPPAPPYGAPLQQGYGSPPQQGYDSPPQQGYGPPPQQGYGPPPQQGYGPPPQQGYGPPPQQGYGPPQGYAPPPQQQPPGYAAMPVQPATSGYGDAANEHLRMKRGRYSAWVWVGFAFCYQIGFLGLFPGFAVVYLLALAKVQDGAVLGFSWLGVLLAVGIPGAYLTYRDRWRCTEAFTSRFCSGMAGISMFYVPWIAFVYANVRLVQKLTGK